MRTLIAAGIMLAASGCATQSFVVNEPTATVATTDVMQPFFISGLGQTQEIDAAEICDGAENVGRVETQMSFMNGLLGALSSGIYTPRQATVYCVQHARID